MNQDITGKKGTESSQGALKQTPKEIVIGIQETRIAMIEIDIEIVIMTVITWK